MVKKGRKRRESMKQRFNIHLAREIRDTWGGKDENGREESFEYIVKNMHEALKKLKKLLDDNEGESKRQTARELNNKLGMEANS